MTKALAVDATRLNDIVRGRRGISADTALRLARHEKLKKIEAEVAPKARVA